jgi:hypothetical protein
VLISLQIVFDLTERFSLVKCLQNASCKFQLVLEIFRFLNTVRIHTHFLVLKQHLHSSEYSNDMAEISGEQLQFSEKDGIALEFFTADLNPY